jgi:hypothetical protein
MPAEFLSDEQRAAYGSFEELPSLSDLEKFFFLDAFDRNVIARSRQDAHRLGWRSRSGRSGTRGCSWPIPSPCRGRWWTNKINRKKIHTQWSDMVRVAGSLVTNQVRAYDLLRMFSRNGNPTPLGQAFAEYGRIDKTLHLLGILDPIDDTYHRRLNKQLTVQESHHRLARKICHGGGGQIRQPYREGQEDQLAALGLVVNAAALWNTRYLSAAVDQLRAQGVPVKDEDVARLSPLGHAHINFLGR